MARRPDPHLTLEDESSSQLQYDRLGVTPDADADLRQGEVVMRTAAAIQRRHGTTMVVGAACAVLWIILSSCPCVALCGDDVSPEFALHTMATGGVVRGTVTDSRLADDPNTDNPGIMGCTVLVLDEYGTECGRRSTSGHGFFEIEMPPGTYRVEVTVTDEDTGENLYFPYSSELFECSGAGVAFDRVLPLETSTVFLLHGIFGSPGSWDPGWVDELALQGYTAILPELPGSSVGGLVTLGTQTVKQQAEHFAEEEVGRRGVRSFYIVAHSQGGLVARWYIERLGGRGVIRLFTLATPHHGSQLTWLEDVFTWVLQAALPPGWGELSAEAFSAMVQAEWPAVLDLRPNSRALKLLNRDTEALDDWRGFCIAYPPDESLAPVNTQYCAVTATDPSNNVWMSFGAATLAELSLFTCWRTDGVVPGYSAPLWAGDVPDEPFVRNYLDYVIGSGSGHMKRPADRALGIAKDPVIRDWVLDWLFQSDTPSSHWIPPDYPREADGISSPCDGGRALAALPIIQDIITGPAVATHALSVEATDTLSVIMLWHEGSMSLFLDDPMGAQVDTSFASIDRDAGAVMYGIDSPMPGEWTLRVVAHSSAPAQRYMVLPAVGSETSVRTEVNPGSARPGETVRVESYVLTAGVPELGASVEAKVVSPDGTSLNLSLFDDGTHGDASPDDGTYTNEHVATTGGSYSVSAVAVTASGGARGSRGLARQSWTSFAVAESCDVAITPGSTAIEGAPFFVDVGYLVTSEVANYGDAACDSVLLRLCLGGREKAYWDTIVSLAPHQSQEFQALVVPDAPGTLSVFAEARVLGALLDEDSSNDWEGLQFVAGVGVPNLTIDAVTPSNPNPAPGEPITADIMVSNNNTARSTGTFVDVYYDLDEPPVEGERGDHHIYLQPLMPGESFTLTTQPFSYLDAALYSLCVQVDPDALCSESDEGDNTDCIPVDTPVESSFYAVATEEGRVTLRWSFSYLPEVEAFSIYRGLSESGPFGRVNVEPIPVTSTSAFADTGVWPGTEFWYELRGIDAAGAESTLAGPVPVTTGGSLSFQLTLASPNPTSERTTFALDLAQDFPRARVAIYDVAGRLIRTVIEGPMDRGRHVVIWDLTSDSGNLVAAGVYFAKASAGEWTRTRKMVVIR